jgi:hypothetical protein
MTARRRASLFIALASATTLTVEALAAAPRYAMKLDASNADHGVKTVSLVANPAIQRGWVALSAIEPTAATAKRIHLSAAGQRQVLTGPALIPGQQILRLDAEGNPFFITFDEQAIADTQRQYAKQLCHTSTNEDHATDLQGNVVEENWIIEDPTCDKAVALGLSDLPKGTWMMSMHVPDADYWQNEIATGNKTGFSIEGLFSTEQLTLSAVKPTAISSVKNWFSNTFAKLTALGAEKAAEFRAALGLEQLADGRSVSIDDATGAVSVVDADGNAMPLADGTYPLEGGGELVVVGGLRKAPEPAAEGDANLEGDTATAPAPLAADAGTADIVKTINDLIAAIGKGNAPAENPATAPGGAKLMAAQLAGTEVVSLKLDSIELADGGKLTLNPVSKRLANADGSLVESGYFAAADGSYFRVSTDQWFYQIDKPTYDAVYGAQLQAVELADAKAKLAKTPAGTVVKLGGDAAVIDAPALTPAQVRLARAEATR